MPDDLTADLMVHLQWCLSQRTQHFRLKWVMNAKWETEVRKMKDQFGYPIWQPVYNPYLYGYPIRVTGDTGWGGVPHLEVIPDRF